MFSRYFILCSALVLSNIGQCETLKEIYQLAEENDHQLQADKAAYLADKESAAINRSALLPQISGAASVSDETISPNDNNRPTENVDDTAYELKLTQSIINTSDWYHYQQGKVQSQLAAVRYSAAQQSLVFRVTEAYVNVLSALDQLTTSKAEENAFSHQLDQIRQRYEVGLISINDVLEAQAAYDSAIANTFDAQGNLGIQFDALGVLTGRVHDSIAILKRDFPVKPPSPLDRQQWIELALENNYDLMVSKLAVEEAGYNTKSTTSDHYPTLSGVISYGGQDRDSSILSRSVDAETQKIGLSLNIPIYSGGNTSSRRQQAYQNEMKAREEYLLLKRNTIQSARALHLSVATDVRQIIARKQAIISNQSALHAIQAGYDAGTRDIVDVVNAQNNLSQSQRDYFNSLYNYILNSLRLEEVVGRLVPANLDYLEKWLDTGKQVSRQQLVQY
jgi:outer membrane protein